MPTNETDSAEDDRGVQINQAADDFVAAVEIAYPGLHFRQALHRGTDVGRYILLAMDHPTSQVRAVFLAEYERSTARLQITSTLYANLKDSDQLPDPFRAIALAPLEVEPRRIEA